jgi:hypothetical protein
LEHRLERAALTNSQRDRAAKYWLKKYGEPIDCDELTRVVSPRNLSANRLLTALHRSYEELIKLLEKQARELEDFSAQRFVRGTKSTLSGMQKSHAEKRGEEDAVRPFPFKLIKDHVDFGRRIAQTARVQLNNLPSWETLPVSRAADLDYRAAVHHVAEWIRGRHRNGRGELDRRMSWPDCVKCLEWHGVPIERLSVGRDPEGALRKMEERFLQSIRDAESLKSDSF